MTVETGAAGIESDDFQSGSTLDSTWTQVNGNSETWWGQGTGDAGITLSVPATGLFEMWDAGANASLIHQVCTDSDFTIESRWTTDNGSDSLESGMFIANAAITTFVAFQWYGTTLYSHNSGTQWTDGGTATDRRIRMVYTASGQTITCQYWNGSDWTTQHFDGDLGVAAARVGIFVGNNVTDNANSQNCDYFFEDSAPIVPEDGITSTRRIMVIS